MRKYQKHIIFFFVSLCVGGVVAIHAGQDQNFDLLNYHYVNAYSFIQNRGERDIAPGELESYMNPLPDIPSYILISHLSPRKAAGVLGMIQGINIWVIFEIMLFLMKRIKAKPSLKIVIAAGVALASFFGAASLSEVGNTMGDNLASIYVLLGLLGLLYSLDRKPRFNRRTVRIFAYIMVGIGAGLKLTNAVYVVGLLAAGLLIEENLKNKIKEGIINSSAAVLGILLSAGYWYVRTWQLFKNPIFPFYNGVFKSPYYLPVNFVDQRWHPTSFMRAVFYPFYITSKQSISSEIAFKDPRLAVALCLIVLVVIVAGARKLKHKKSLPNWSREHSVFWVFFLVSYALWIKEFSYYRYLIPLELICLVAIATTLYSLIPRFFYATATLVVIVVCIASATVPINWGRIAWRPTFFGITKSNFVEQDNSVILMAGVAPLGFVVPYLPSSSQVIRVESDLTSPKIGTSTMQAYMQGIVKDKERKDTKFYAIRADEDSAEAEITFSKYGFRMTGCKALLIYTRENLPSKIRLCTLVSDN